MSYRTCPYCGANNDPGEICDCRSEKDGNVKKQESEQMVFDIPKPEEPKVHRHHNVAI